MKKKLIIILLVLIILIGIGVVLWEFVLEPVFFHDEPYINEPVLSINYDDSGRKFTKRTLEWQPATSKNVIEYIPNKVGLKSEILYFDHSEYIELSVPNTAYIYQHGKSILAVDGSFSVRVQKNIPKSEVAGIAGLLEYEVISGNLEDDGFYMIGSKLGKKGTQTIAKYFGNDNVVVITVAGDSEYYSIFYNSMISINKTKSMRGSYASLLPEDIKDWPQLKSLPKPGNYAPTITADMSSIEVNRFDYENGYLYVYMSLESLHNTDVNESLSLFKISGQTMKDWYVSGVGYGNLVYFNTTGSGDNQYHMMYKAINSNSCWILYGKGEEAYANMLYFIGEYE